MSDQLSDEEMEAMYARYAASSASSLSYAKNPWKVSHDLDGWLVASLGSGENGDVYVVCDGVHASVLCGDADADAAFIAAMPTDFKRLFKEVLRLREELEALRGEEQEP